MSNVIAFPVQQSLVWRSLYIETLTLLYRCTLIHVNAIGHLLT
ncbi:MAG: hypothetical protein WAN66_10755 [Limnoraphis robusta]|nr:hypothetical protein [Limnoraphis robusta]